MWIPMLRKQVGDFCKKDIGIMRAGGLQNFQAYQYIALGANHEHAHCLLYHDLSC
jgi:hypothetical protein